MRLRGRSEEADREAQDAPEPPVGELVRSIREHPSRLPETLAVFAVRHRGPRAARRVAALRAAHPDAAPDELVALAVERGHRVSTSEGRSSAAPSSGWSRSRSAPPCWPRGSSCWNSPPSPVGTRRTGPGSPNSWCSRASTPTSRPPSGRSPPNRVRARPTVPDPRPDPRPSLLRSPARGPEPSPEPSPATSARPAGPPRGPARRRARA
ncbi:hypothetical protein ACFQ0M_42110 [Kitasatospora aburaviensis]